MLYIKQNGDWRIVSSSYIKQNGEWVTMAETGIPRDVVYVFAGANVEPVQVLGPDTFTGLMCNYVAVLGSDIVTSACTWSIVSGSEYAFINPNNGEVGVKTAANNSPVTISATYGAVTSTKEILLTYDTTVTSSTHTVIATDDSGNVATTVIIDSENTNGTSVIETTTTITDEDGNVIGTMEGTRTNNNDGSYNSTTTTYDENGDPTSSMHASGDTSGNINRQEVVYDESGNSAVTAYSIDTDENPDGSKNYNGDGVNTEYYAFDLTEGFVMDYHFTIDFANQPSGQDENHHNILTAKRANPSPWYGFQIRQTSTARTVTFGTQFATGSNTNTSVSPMSMTGSVGEYNFKVIYDPTASTNKFRVLNANTSASIFTSNNTFPDIDDLKYLKVTLGYAMDTNGDPFRYSNINVMDFNIQKLNAVSTPSILCSANTVSLSCRTSGASIYYRVNRSGDYVLYTAPFAISAITVVDAYAEADYRQSAIASETCMYDNGLVAPSISCDGEYVTITCETSGASIYFKSGSSEDFSVYQEPFAITADTMVYAYATLDGDRSSTVSENCIYNPEEDYYKEYLTFDVTSGGSIFWATSGSVPSKTIEYSINNGTWQTITSSSNPQAISVETGDKVRFRGLNSTYAVDNSNCVGFHGSTAVFNVEGNAMSLVYSDNFVNNDSLVGTYNFKSLFQGSCVASAENLVLPTTALTPYCYRGMFAFCSGMTVGPELPATSLASGCYRYMFEECRQLNSAPELPATVLVEDCYNHMFYLCERLNYIKCLASPVTTSAMTDTWVSGVAKKGTFVKDANATWLIGVNGIPTGWVIVDEGLSKPTISCDGLEITLDCDTQGADIYYKLDDAVTYTLYSSPIPITADTYIETYSSYSGETSDVVSATCVYDDGITEPVITCDGEYISISCDTGGATIYYRLNQTGSYTEYETAILISADTICEAYSEIDGRQSETVSATCIYDESLKAPIIECDGTEVTITCHTVGADIYYRLDDESVFTQYVCAITITADTLVQAYSTYSGETSSTVSAMCIYNPYHDYSKDYLTFDVLTNGTIGWKSVGTGQSKTIHYSINNEPWSSITATASATIPVSAGDKVRFKSTNASYAKDKSNYSGFEGGTAMFNIEGNIMSLIYGDDFADKTTFSGGTYNFCSLFKLSQCIDAGNLILPATALTEYCYRAMFSNCYSLTMAPALPALTLSKGCYWYLFENCAFTEAPDLLAPVLVAECYGNMFTGCTSLNYIRCLAVSGFSTSNCRQNWVKSVASSGTFVKDSSVSVSTWTRGISGIPTNWLVYDDVSVATPEIFCDGYNNVTITTETQGATIYYRLNREGDYSAYTATITISADTFVEAYAEMSGEESRVISQTCQYISDIPYEASNRSLSKWNYNNQEVTTPYSVNGEDGHSSSYAKGTFNFETTFALREAQPTYLWFQHADQSATVYIDNVLVEKHWGGYNAFFVDVTNFVHSGSNVVKVALKNNEGNYLAPAAGDFNFNATLGNVKLFTSPCIPAMNYGYDGFHVTSDVATSSATIYVKTNVPTGAVVTCEIDDGTYHYGTSANSTGDEMIFSATVANPHLWNGTLDPHLYDITMEIYHNGDLYHRYVRPYGLRFYEYVIDAESGDGTYTGFLLNGQPYLLRGCCMHDDIAGKANALNNNDYATTFATIQELGCNFLRLAHYPHPKETYDWCDRLGIIVQTEGSCVNKMQSTMPADYYDHLNIQYDDMVNQHYNHPCIVFWGLSNETTTDDKEFAKTKINGYIARIRALDNSRLIGYVMAQGPGQDPSQYYNNPDADWFGCNIYDGWYTSQNSNNPTSSLNTRFKNVVTNKGKILCYSEYGCGGTQRCHSDDFMTTTTRGNNPRHDIEYMMWLHEGEIAAIKNFPQLAFTSQWQLFDIAVANRNEGYTVCLDGVNTSEDDSLRRLNNKGLVERDHVTKKDPFYLYKAWWNTTDKFVHICGKNYTKKVDRAIKCYTNDGTSLSMYVNGALVETVTATDNIAVFTATTFNSGDVIRVAGSTSDDTLTFD